LERVVAEPVVIIGAGGFGRETVDVIEAINATAAGPPWDLIGVVDDTPSQTNLDRLAARGIAYLGTTSRLVSDVARPHYVVGIGSPGVRRTIVERLDAAGFSAATLVHPDASLGSCVEVGEGSVVMAGARMTTNISVGRHVHLNPNVTIGHDTILEDFVSMNPASSVSGECLVRTGALIGVGAVVLNQRTVGPGALVGASACVVRDVEAASTVKGVPAR
jgi:sugar O-acyltransferase (sialic acid O-acetyltransferase NeuD family)